MLLYVSFLIIIYDINQFNFFFIYIIPILKQYYIIPILKQYYIIENSILFF